MNIFHMLKIYINNGIEVQQINNDLTKREKEIAELIVRGETNQYIREKFALKYIDKKPV